MMRQILFLLHANHNLPITRTDLKLMENDHATLFLVTFRIDISLAKMSKEFIIYHDLSHISTAERFARKIGNRRTLFFFFLICFYRHWLYKISPNYFSSADFSINLESINKNVAGQIIYRELSTIRNVQTII